MSSKNSRLRIAFLAVVVGLAGLATAGPAAAATTQHTAAAVSSVPAEPVLVDFLDLPTAPLVADGEQHEFTVTYRNESSADQTVAPQLLVESPDAGPFLEPTDITVERRTPGGCWKAVELGSQTGTLYTDLATAQRTLHAGDTLTAVYRVTVTDPEAEGTVHPRVALYG
ncbi:signal peptide protein [Streptomyces sp. A30]|uniref:signal peptide protein n=1 Tax=Streptomyces sp. A30 TaxID=2789273 RepID=UPI00397FFCF0